MRKRMIALLLAAILVIGGCGSAGNGTAGGDAGAASADLTAAADDYYIDLTELGMKLTIYLRLAEDGNFLFSNTPAFEVNKSSGTWQKSEEGYLMVFTSVNGEEKSISDGLTSSFVQTEDGNLDFTGCERIYYGSASATTTSAEYPDAKLIAVPIPEDYEAPDTATEFTAGTYLAENNSEESSCTLTFFEDGSYLMFFAEQVDGQTVLRSEGGSYSVSTTQLAMEPEGGSGRVSNDVVSEDTLSVNVPDAAGERSVQTFHKTESAPAVLLACEGTGEENGTEFAASLTIFTDGSYETEAEGFKEGGVIAINTADGVYKTYPDHPTEGLRGLKQVASVPSGSCSRDGETVTFTDFRIRTSENLSRSKCVYTGSWE